MPGPIPSGALHVCYWVFDQTCVCPWRHGYVGVTKNRETRQRQHLRRFNGARFQILFRGSQRECRKVEYALRPVAGIGWNKSPGGQRSQPWTGESRAKVSEAMKRINTVEVRARKSDARMGYVLSEETKRKISKVHEGKKLRGVGWRHSEETKQKIREAQKGKPRPWLIGHVVSEETRRKIGAAQKGKVCPPVSEETRRKLSEAGKGNKNALKEK